MKQTSRVEVQHLQAITRIDNKSSSNIVEGTWPLLNFNKHNKIS